MHNDAENEDSQTQQQALEPVEQDSIAFHGEQIIAVRLADGRICVVVRWICESLNLQTGGQVRRIVRTASTAKELVRVRVQTGGGRQTMPAITLRGFSPWVLGLNPNEVKSDNPTEDERIRALIVAYQEEAKDVLYEHFVSKGRTGTALSAPAAIEPIKPESDASDDEIAAYYENLAAWALRMAGQYAQRWRGGIEAWRGQIEGRLESKEAMLDLLPEILERLGPEKLTDKHQNTVKHYVQQLSRATGKHSGTIYSSLYTAFEVPKYQEILEEDWPKVENWFQVQMERAKKK
jgi:P22_AR N-terminal domain